MSEYICPYCKNPIDDDDALRCIYCGETLNRGIGFMGKIKYPTPRVIIVIVVVIVILSFILLII